MDQGKPSGFSHITIGQDEKNTELPDEEIEFIGAVESVGSIPTKAATVEDRVVETQLRVETHTQASQPETDEQTQVSESDDDDEQPMVLARRIIMALSGVGIVMIVLYVMDYWQVINLPF